jgi:nitroreductase/NAD-dependent dihydropyrimidine dehydrogenase PreA subunit
MPILGINLEKCSHCQVCIRDCPTKNYRLNESQSVVVFNNSNCILCGHCIGVCPESAILYDNMEDEVLEYKDGKDPSELVSYNSLYQLMRSKRSIRQYKSQKVPEESIKRVINSMRYAPTGGNMRNIKCLVISKKERINQLTDSIINVLESSDTRERFKSSREVGYDPIFSKNPYDTRNSTIAITYGMLSAETLGLGSCWIGYAHGILTDFPHICRDLTGIETYVLGVITLGYPSVKYYRAPPRPPIQVREIN